MDTALVTAEQIANFEADGAVRLPQVVSAEWLDSLRTAGEEAVLWSLE